MQALESLKLEADKADLSVLPLQTRDQIRNPLALDKVS